MRSIKNSISTAS